MIGLAAVVGVSTLVGVGAERRFRGAADGLSQRLMGFLLWVVIPLVAFFNIASLELDLRIGAGILFAYAAQAVTLLLAFAIGTFALRLERPSVGALMLVAAFANTGFLGLPFALALLGPQALGTAVAYDVLVSALTLVTVGFSLGAAFGLATERPAERVRAFFARNPPLYATLAGFLAPAALAPGWAVTGTQWLVLATVPVGFFVVGVTLARERRREDTSPARPSAVVTGVALKLLVAPAIVVGLSALLIEVPEAYVSQAAMASGVNNLVIANAYGLDRGLASAGIAWSTVAVLGVGIALEQLA